MEHKKWDRRFVLSLLTHTYLVICEVMIRYERINNLTVKYLAYIYIYKSRIYIIAILGFEIKLQSESLFL